MRYRTLVCSLLAILVCPADSALAASLGRVVYVNVAAEGYNDGTSWDDAYTDLQFALDDVELTGDCLPNSPCEIWVAAGTYFPSKRTDPNDPTSATFRLMNNVGIFGGFGGWESHRGQRNIDLNETIFHGDHNMDDDPTLEPLSNCCTARPDEGGCDDSVCEETVIGSSLYHSYDYCVDNWDTRCAGAARSYCCDLCRPSYCDNSGPVVLAEDVDATAVLDGVTIIRGETYFTASGFYLDHADATVRRCTFMDNGQAAVRSIWGDPSFEDCTFIRNRYSAAHFNVGTGEPSFTNCDFIENSGSGLFYRSNQLMSGCRFIRNGETGLDLWSGAPTIENCLFIENTSDRGAPGGVAAYGDFAQLINCGFYGNTGTPGGLGGRNIILINCVFSGNQGGRRGAMTVSNEGAALLLNCTFVGNRGSSVGALGAYGLVDVENSIFWDNVSGAEVGAGISYSEYPPSINYSVLQNWLPYSYGVGNVDLNPRFVDANGRDNIVGTGDDNLRLAMYSPLIDRGDPNPPLKSYRDADGHVRILRGRIDMGAYEFGIGDYDYDLFTTLADFAAWDTCMTGPDEYPFAYGCEPFDFHAEVGDDHIDLRDFAGFQRTINSFPGLTIAPQPERR